MQQSNIITNVNIKNEQKLIITKIKEFFADINIYTTKLNYTKTEADETGALETLNKYLSKQYATFMSWHKDYLSKNTNSNHDELTDLAIELEQFITKQINAISVEIHQQLNSIVTNGRIYISNYNIGIESLIHEFNQIINLKARESISSLKSEIADNGNFDLLPDEILMHLLQIIASRDRESITELSQVSSRFNVFISRDLLARNSVINKTISKIFEGKNEQELASLFNEYYRDNDAYMMKLLLEYSDYHINHLDIMNAVTEKKNYNLIHVMLSKTNIPRYSNIQYNLLKDAILETAKNSVVNDDKYYNTIKLLLFKLGIFQKDLTNNHTLLSLIEEMINSKKMHVSKLLIKYMAQEPEALFKLLSSQEIIKDEHDFFQLINYFLEQDLIDLNIIFETGKLVRSKCNLLSLVLSLHDRESDDLIKLVQTLIAKNPGLLKPDASLKSPLFLAIYNRMTSVVKIILENGADVNADLAESTGYNSLLYFTIGKYIKNSNDKFIEIIEILLEYKPDLFSKNSENHELSLFTLYSQYSSHKKGRARDILEILSKFGFHINSQNTEGNTILHEAIICVKEAEFIYKLLQEGANFDISNNKGQTALDLAYDSHFNVYVTNKFSKSEIVNSITKLVIEKISKKPFFNTAYVENIDAIIESLINWQPPEDTPDLRYNLIFNLDKVCQNICYLLQLIHEAKQLATEISGKFRGEMKSERIIRAIGRAMESCDAVLLSPNSTEHDIREAFLNNTYPRNYTLAHELKIDRYPSIIAEFGRFFTHKETADSYELFIQRTSSNNNRNETNNNNNETNNSDNLPLSRPGQRL